MNEMDEEERKLFSQALETAAERVIERIIQRQYENIGKWAFRVITSLILVAILHFLLKTSGWIKI